MKLWLRRHRIIAQHAKALAFMIMAALLSGQVVMVPGLFGGDSRFPLTLMAALPTSLFIALMHSRPDDLEASAARPLAYLTVGHVTGLYALTALLLAVCSIVTGPAVWIYLRALVGLSSIGLIAGERWGQRAGTITPAIFFCLASLIGSNPLTYTPYWWNFILAEYDAAASAALVVVLFAVQVWLPLHRMHQLRRALR